MSTSTYTVTGMTCGHCVASVREEIGEIPGVNTVDVTLETGVVEIESDRELGRDEVSEAVSEAGYELV
ncbi:heavy-metal-associated domain-containing protein [Gordonia otitidis]|uniref:Copper chaperone CopZ n=1 Tax=Gordonia otitidis (strain DSM 44809 / CCUG 52243 / JCM 12355 / NBRC 100426 / IFM 10032) TaxID=1108044 RepID=H5TTT7_GORO1|nr:heavy metal-associated domain-containing protein [Gordonia otitidis]GAB36895.1 copper chaperone CopZ [Gordonia otitidis NBRC 100426]